MSLPLDLAPSEFAAALTPERLRVGMRLHLALAVGPTMLLGVLVSIAFSRQGGTIEPGDLDLMSVLTAVNLVAFVACAVLGERQYRSFLRPPPPDSGFQEQTTGLQVPSSASTPAEKAISAIRVATLMRAALYEGSALFGICVLIIPARDGSLLNTPWLWVNLTPAVGLLLLMAFTIPTSGRLQHIFEANMARGS